MARNIGFEPMSFHQKRLLCPSMEDKERIELSLSPLPRERITTLLQVHVEVSVGVEPTTWWLQITCAANYAIRPYCGWINAPALVLIILTVALILLFASIKLSSVCYTQHQPLFVMLCVRIDAIKSYWLLFYAPFAHHVPLVVDLWTTNCRLITSSRLIFNLRFSFQPWPSSPALGGIV